ncbi:MAG TPA: aminotransferase class V-fold PLP-dependent enzyme [Bryobacteraceae bacterium]|nr:aminotransferase class V-fold PLP-dependent enzyme [Bryobacteraceae bacterium]
MLDVIGAIESRIAGGPILPNVTVQEIRSHLTSRYDFSHSMALEDVVADVEEMLSKWQVQVTHPRYLGLFNPSVTKASVVADTLTAACNPQLATWRTSPAANEIERHTLAWLSARFGFPDNAAANFTTGGAESNLTAVVVALTRMFHGYGEHGLTSLPARPTIYLSSEAHHSFHKIAHMAGLGRKALRTIAADSRLRLDLESLRKQIREDRQDGLAPFMVVGTAGSTAAGAIDPLPELAEICNAQRLWFHVDAAWGGAAVISPALRPHLNGIHLADSITCDAHKWFSVAMGAGMFFCRHADALAEAFHAETSYMPDKSPGAVFDPYVRSVQWSRRFIGLKLFLGLAELGSEGYANQIEHQAQMGELLRESLRHTGWTVLNDTPFPLVCFTRDGLDTQAFVAALHKQQIAWMSQVEIGGVPVVRACITSFRTTAADIEYIIREMNRLL